jgi:hypothetical protein
MAVKHIHGSTTTLNGCTVEIDGDVVYALSPPPLVVFAPWCILPADRTVQWRHILRERRGRRFSR